MARQKGPFKAQGSMGGYTFIKRRDGYFIKEKGGVSAERMHSDPAYAVTRENWEEFGAASQAGELLRTAVESIVTDVRDTYMVSRATQLMTQIKDLDTNSPHGKRTVGGCIALPEAKSKLKRFNFNIDGVLRTVLFSPITVDVKTGAIHINNFIPRKGIKAPKGATHVTFQGAFAKVDFVTGTHSIELSNEVNLPLDRKSTSVVLTPAGVPVGSGTSIYLLKILFYQMVNGVEYPLKERTFNCVQIIEVA